MLVTSMNILFIYILDCYPRKKNEWTWDALVDEQRPDENNNLLVGLGYECGESKENTSQPTNQANA